MLHRRPPCCSAGMGCDMGRLFHCRSTPRSHCCLQDALLDALGVMHGATKLPRYECYVHGQMVQVRCPGCCGPAVMRPRHQPAPIIRSCDQRVSSHGWQGPFQLGLGSAAVPTCCSTGFPACRRPAVLHRRRACPGGPDDSAAGGLHMAALSSARAGWIWH